MANKSIVALAKEPTIQESVSRVFELLGGVENLIEPGDSVVLKPNAGHASMVFSCALKNIKGPVQDRVHMDMHKQNLTMAMMDVWYAVRADINIVDAIWAAGGFSPHTPVPLKVGCILGSQDPVAVDRIACDLVGIDTDQVDYFKTAKEAGMGHSDLDEIEVVGEKVSDCFTRMWVPYVGDMSKRWPEYDVRCEGACSSCQALLALSMEKLKAIGAYEACRNTHVVIGGKNDLSDITDNENLVLHGNCTFRYLKDHPGARWIKDCPPEKAASIRPSVRACCMTPRPTRTWPLAGPKWQRISRFGPALCGGTGTIVLWQTEMSFCAVSNGRRLRWLLRDIFPDAFMQRHTNFPSFQVFCYSSAVIVNWAADPMIYDEALLDYFVRESAEFSDWETMVRCAADERFSGSVQGESI